MGVAEGKIENYLKREVKAKGGFCFKLVGHKGIPDRLVILPGAQAAFCELKAENGTISAAQILMTSRLRTKGYIAKFACCYDDVDTLLQEILDSRKDDSDDDDGDEYTE